MSRKKIVLKHAIIYTIYNASQIIVMIYLSWVELKNLDLELNGKLATWRASTERSWVSWRISWRRPQTTFCKPDFIQPLTRWTLANAPVISFQKIDIETTVLNFFGVTDGHAEKIRDFGFVPDELVPRHLMVPIFQDVNSLWGPKHKTYFSVMQQKFVILTGNVCPERFHGAQAISLFNPKLTPFWER